MREVMTIGHSTLAWEDFLQRLRQHDVRILVDVRAIPRSRRHPQFAGEVLAPTLKAAGIEYRHMVGLGGLRKPRRDSPNQGWRNESFRGYADYMLTEAFQHSLADLIAVAARARTAILCAEAVPWRCHRSLVADALLAREVPVQHILGSGRLQAHRMTPFAVANGPQVTYPFALTSTHDPRES